MGCVEEYIQTCHLASLQRKMEGENCMAVDLIHGDRRSAKRYECSLDLRFEHRNGDEVLCVGHGVTADLCSGGLRFHTEERLPDGAHVVTRIAWPFLLQNVCPLELILEGSVRSVTGRGTVVAVRTYEFRTCGARSFWEEPPASSMCRVA